MSSVKGFGYYGGKNSKLSWILPELITPHHTFIELCAGSAAVLLNKPRAKVEILNDLAQEVTTFWRTIRDNKEQLIQAIMDSPPGESEFQRILSLPPTDDDIETARRFYVHVQQAFSSMPTHQHHSFYRGSFRYDNARKGLGIVADRMRGVVVENTDANRLITRAVNAHRCHKGLRGTVLFYVDPPYTTDSRKSAGEYIHDDFNHETLLETITNAPSFCKFLISGYANPLYDKQLANWHRTEIEVPLKANNQVKQTRTEILWRNYTPQQTRQLI